MPRTVPAAITALIGEKPNIAPVVLLKWELASGTVYFSSREAVTYGGNPYVANKIKEASGLDSPFIDRKSKDYGKARFVFDNMPETVGGSLPFQTLDAAASLEDRRMTVYLFFPSAADAVLLWWGYSGPPVFNDTLDDPTCEVEGTFIWDSESVVVPTMSLPEAGFAQLATNRNSDSASEEFIIPLVYGVANIQVRPTVYAWRIEDGYAHLNFIVSSCANGLPFGAGDVPAADCRIFGNTAAQVVDFKTGSFAQTAPDNLTRFPDGGAHPGIAYGYAAFLIADGTKDRVDNIEPDEIKMVLANGRPLIDTGLPSENPVLILKDILRDPTNGLGLANSDFDATAITNAANYVATRFASRVEIHERLSVGELVQKMCTEIGGYLTFNNGKIQIGVKNNAEATVAQFSTINSGYSYRKIHNDEVRYYAEDADQTVNELVIEYRKKNRHKDRFRLFDSTAQSRPGGTIQKVNSQDLELFSLYDETMATIAGAIYLREEQSANLFIEFETPVVEGLLPAPGDVIEVRSPSILNNASNYLFRVIRQTPVVGDESLMTFKCRVYKPAVYDYNATGIGMDLLRGTSDTSSQGRAPDVTPVSLSVSDPVANDTEGKLVTILGTFTYPAIDTASDAANNIAREYPIAGVMAMWKYSDESIHQARWGAEVKYPVTQFLFHADYYKNRSIDVFFIALGHNRSWGQLGYIPDVTKVTSLTANLSSTNPTASVVATAAFTVNDYVYIEREIAKLTAKTSNSLTFQASGGNRAPQFSTTAIAHPSGTQVAVAKQSYPSLNIALTAPRFTYPVVAGFAAKQRHDGVLLHCDDVSAENHEKYYFYWSIDADANTNVNKLGSATPAWFVSNPDAPPAGVNLVRADEPSFKVRQEDIGNPGTIVYARVAARNGKHNWSSQLSSLGSNRLGDDAVPTVSSAPVIVPKQIGFRVKCPLPTSNMKTFGLSGKVEIVLEARNASNTVLGYITDSGSTYGTQAGEYRFDVGLERSQTFNLKKGDVLALFPTISTLKVYFYVTNAVGTSAASPVASLTVSTWEVDPLADDSGVPSGLSTPVQKYQNGVLTVKNVSATTNVNTLDHYDVVIKGYNSLGTFLGYIETTNWTFTSSESTAKTSIGAAGKMAFNVKAAQFVSAFGATGQFKIYFYAVNSKGTSLASLESSAISISSIVDPIGSDASAPATLGTPRSEFTPKVGVTIDSMSVGANWNQPISKKVVIFTDTGSTIYFDLPTYMATGGATAQAAASEAAARYSIGVGKEQVTLGVALAALRSVLGASANVKVYFYAENPIGTTQSSTSTTFFNVATAKDFVNSKHSVNAIVGGAIAIPGKQVFPNSDFFIDDGAGGIQRWLKWDGTSYNINANAAAIDAATSNVRWDKAIDALKFLTTTNWVVLNLKKGRILPGVKFSMTFQAKSDATPSGLILRVFFKHNTNSAVDNLDNQVNGSLVYQEFPLTGLNTGFQEFGGLLKVKDSPTIDDGASNLVDQWIAFQLVGTLSGANVWFDKFMFNRGTIPASHSILESEEGVISITPTAIAAQADIPNIIGVDGGWQSQFGAAGRVERNLA